MVVRFYLKIGRWVSTPGGVEGSQLIVDESTQSSANTLYLDQFVGRVIKIGLSVAVLGIEIGCRRELIVGLSSEVNKIRARGTSRTTNEARLPERDARVKLIKKDAKNVIKGSRDFSYQIGKHTVIYQ